MKLSKTITCGSLILLLSASCMPQSNTGQGGLYGAGGGAAAGAIVGQIAGGDTESTLIGAAIGAAIGGLSGAGVGKMMDNQERDMRAALADSEAAAVKREGDLLAISLKGDLTFDTNSSKVKPGFQPEMNRIANVLYQYPQTVVLIEGHTDSRGSEEYNLDLSQRRADAVKNLLAQNGLSTNRIETRAYGESLPVATNETESGRQLNRRVEIKIAPNQ